MTLFETIKIEVVLESKSRKMAKKRRKGSNLSNQEEKKEKRDERKHLEKVVKTDVHVQKPSIMRKIRTNLFGDNLRSIGQFLAQDVIFPAVKDLAYDSVTTGVERAIFGEVRSRGRRSYSQSRPGYTPYNRYGYAQQSSKDRNQQRRDEDRREAPRQRKSYDDIVIATRAEAEAVLDQMVHTIEQYDIVSVADLYELVGITGSFTDDKWGWTDLSRSKVSRIRDGYILDLPRPEPID